MDSHLVQMNDAIHAFGQRDWDRVSRAVQEAGKARVASVAFRAIPDAEFVAARQRAAHGYMALLALVIAFSKTPPDNNGAYEEASKEATRAWEQLLDSVTELHRAAEAYWARLT